MNSTSYFPLDYH